MLYPLSESGVTLTIAHRSLAHAEFLKRILQDTPIVRRIQEGIYAWVDHERKNREEHAVRPLMPSLVARLQHHNLYNDIFESFYLKKTNDFYVAEAKELREKLNPAEFIRYCLNREAEERDRAYAVLPEESMDRVILEMDRSFLNGHLDWIAKGCA